VGLPMDSSRLYSGKHCSWKQISFSFNRFFKWTVERKVKAILTSRLKIILCPHLCQTSSCVSRYARHGCHAPVAWDQICQPFTVFVLWIDWIT
jgi:hypothetical protein